MPTFLDHHPKLPPLPPEVAAQMVARIEAGRADEFGVRPVNVFTSADGRGWCVTEAPDAESVIRSHEAVGFSLDAPDVTQVTPLA